MYLGQIPIETGAAINVELENGEIFNCRYVDNLSYKSFYVDCDDLKERISELEGVSAEIELLYEDAYWACQGKIRGLGQPPYAMAGAQDSVKLEVCSAFVSRPRRNGARLDMDFRVQIFEHNPEKRQSAGNHICDGITSDISPSGLRLWSDYAFEDSPKTVFTSIFSLEPDNPYRHFSIPIVLEWKRENTATGSYDYDYGFSFDFGDDLDLQEKLKDAIFEVKLKSFTTTK